MLSWTQVIAFTSTCLFFYDATLNKWEKVTAQQVVFILIAVAGFIKIALGQVG